MGSYYLLGYYSTNNAKDGKYRRISVKLNNKIQGAKLEHRLGYYADKVWGKLNSQDKDQQLKEALAAGDPATDLPIALQVDYFRVGPTAYFVPVSIKIPGSVIALAAKGGASVTQLDFLGQVQDERKSTVGNVRDFIKIQLDQDKAVALGKKSFQYDAGFTLEPGKYHMKFVVRENITGKMGTFETKFTVPDLSADTSGLKMSTIIWSSQREKVTAAVGSAEKITKKDMTANPLIVGDEKVIPNITKVFRRSQNLYVNFDVYDARPDPANARRAPGEGQHEPVQCEGRESVRSGSARRNAACGDAAGSGAGAVPGAAERPRAGPLPVPDQCGGRSRPEIRISPNAAGSAVRRSKTPFGKPLGHQIQYSDSLWIRALSVSSLPLPKK